MEIQDRRYISEDGREWSVSLESPGDVLSVGPGLQNSGAMLPEDALRIVFRSGEETLSEEYTALSAVEDLSEGDLERWFRAAQRGNGL